VPTYASAIRARKGRRDKNDEQRRGAESRGRTAVVAQNGGFAAMFKKILVPLDDSVASQSILSVVGDLARDTQAEITLFAASHPAYATINGRRRLRKTVALATLTGTSVGGAIPGQPPRYAESRDQAIERRENELTEFLSDAARPLREAGHKVEVQAHFGDPIKEICQLASSGGFDLIAMASSKFGRAFRGSVAEGVLRKGVAPVLLVNAKQRR